MRIGCLEEFALRRSVNLGANAGIVQGLHALFTVASNPYGDTKFCVLDVTYLGHCTGEEYRELLLRLINRVLDHRIATCSLAIVNLGAQMRGLRDCLRESRDLSISTVQDILGFCRKVKRILWLFPVLIT
jgi:hypothetical protein